MQNHQEISYQFKMDPQKLYNQFQCTVCLNPIEDCYITRCGHVYCRKCIEETINRHHRCPNCNQQLSDFKVDVFKNYHFNTIKKIVDDQKYQFNQHYLSGVFNKLQQDKQGNTELMKPIEKVFDSSSIDDSQLLHHILQIYQLMKKSEEKKLLLGINCIKDHKQIIKQLHNFFQKNLPQPIICPQLITVPTKLQIVLPGKKLHQVFVKLAPITHFSNLLPQIQNICSEMNIRIEGAMPSTLKINGQDKNLSQLVGFLAGKCIKIEGIPFQKNIYCYSYNWQKNRITNFYNCTNCGIKWICQNCSLLCHNQHQLIMHLKDHKADWACCYCATKCKCKAINKNSKIHS